MSQKQATRSPSEVALEYFKHWSRKEYDQSAKYLDEKLSFQGPIDKFDNAADYVRAIQRLGQIVKEVRVKKTFVDGGDVCAIYDLVTNSPAGTSPCAEWIHAEDGKVKAIRVFFDARPFAAMFEKH